MGANDSYVYVWTNRANGMRYIGKGRGPRAASHLSRAAGGHRDAPFFHKALAKSPESFDLGFIATALDDKTACSVEAAFIAMYGTQKPGGYNLTAGGDGLAGLTRTPEHSAKIAAANARRVWTPESIEKGAEKRRGRKHTAEHKAKIAEGSRRMSQESRDRQGAALAALHAERISAVADSYDGGPVAKFAKRGGVCAKRLRRELVDKGWLFVRTSGRRNARISPEGRAYGASHMVDE